MDPTETEEEEELVPAKRISGDRRPEGEDEDRSIRTLARSREKRFFGSVLNVANLRKSSLWLNADLICSESLFLIMQRASKTAEKDENLSPTDVFLSDKFP